MQQTAQTSPVAVLAPPLSDELLTDYRQRIEALPARDQLRDKLLELLACCETWWALPESKRRGRLWRTYIPQTDGTTREVDVEVKPLEQEHVDALWDVTPWMDDILAFESIVDRLPSGTREIQEVVEQVVLKDGNPETVEIIRKRGVVADEAAFRFMNMAKHLIWHAKEITLDREPLTADKLPA